jgi:integrase
MPGINKHHASTCGTRRGGRCDCTPGYQAWVWSPKDRKKLYRTLPSHAAARTWRAQATSEVKRGALRAASDTTLREAATAWLAGAREGTVRNRSGDRYKPSTLRGYDQALGLYVLRDLGAHRPSAHQSAHRSRTSSCGFLLPPAVTVLGAPSA